MTDLLGDEMPEPLPSNLHLEYWSDLVGHTIKAVIDSPMGKSQCDALIITDTNCWMALEVESDACGEGAELLIVRHAYSSLAPLVVSDYASAMELLRCGAINHAEHTLLDGAEKERKAKYAKDQAARLRAQAEKLESEIKP